MAWVIQRCAAASCWGKGKAGHQLVNDEIIGWWVPIVLTIVCYQELKKTIRKTFTVLVDWEVTTSFEKQVQVIHVALFTVVSSLPQPFLAAWISGTTSSMWTKLTAAHHKTSSAVTWQVGRLPALLISNPVLQENAVPVQFTTWAPQNCCCSAAEVKLQMSYCFITGA